jgi:hypothetical protein
MVRSFLVENGSMHGNGCKLVHVLMELMDLLPCGKCDLK